MRTECYAQQEIAEGTPHSASCLFWVEFMLDIQMLSAQSGISQDMPQVIGDWVASHTHDEVLAAMAEARVPSGELTHSPSNLSWCASFISSTLQ